MLDLEWTSEWPTEPGLYLFRGSQRRHGAQWLTKGLLEPVVAHVAINANGNLMYVGHDFMRPDEYFGHWAKFEIGMESMHPRARYLLFIQEAWEILVAHAGVEDRDWGRRSFLESFSSDSPPTEWRFQGKFGFGGKFYRADTFRIGYYPEDEKPGWEEERVAINELLHESAQKYQVGPDSYRL